MSLIVGIADAIVVELAGGTFSRAFNPERRLLPAFEVKDLEILRVSVVPKAVEATRASRDAHQFEFQVDVGVQKKVSNVEADVAALLGLVEEIADYLRDRTLARAPFVQCISTANDPVYDPLMLHEKRVFTSALTLTYRAMTG